MATERTVLVRLKANPSDFVRGMTAARTAVRGLTDEIDTTNDKTAWLAQSVLALGPALAPLGAAAVPVFSGLATQFTLTAVAATTAGIAFNGVGDALGALDDYQLEPTEAHLRKLNQTMAAIGPAGAEFVRFLDEIEPQMAALANTAREGIFPGVEDGITSLLKMLPQVQRIVGETAEALGEMSADAGSNLAGPRFAEFFDFLESDAKPILLEMGQVVGNLTDGFAAMLVAFAPLTRDFSTGFADMTKSFADWAHSLSTSSSFGDFVAYIRDAGPKVRELLGALADALIQLIEAAAPVGDLMLPAFTALFEIIAAIADTPLGPIFIGAAAAAGLYGRAVALASITTGGLLGKVVNTKSGIIAQTRAMSEARPTMGAFGTSLYRLGQAQKYQSEQTVIANRAVGTFARRAIPVAGTVGLLAASTTGFADSLGLSNTATLALAGSFVGPLGTGIGAAVGGFLDLRDAANFASDAIRAANIAAVDGSSAQREAARQGLLTQASFLATADGFDANKKRILAFVGGTSEELIAANRRLQNSIRLDASATGDIGGLLTNSLSPALKSTADAFFIASREGNQFSDTLTAIGDNLAATDALLAYRQGILDVNQALKDNGSTVNKSTEAGLANLRALQSFARDILTAMSTMDEGPAREKFFADAVERITTLANKFDSTGRTAKQLRTELGLVDKQPVKPKADLDTTKIDRKLDRLFGALDRLGRTQTEVEIDVTINRFLNDITGTGPKKSKPKPGGLDALLNPTFDQGGWTGPGSKYTPAGIVHADEFVFSKEATSGNVAFLSSLHSEMRGYASGGHVTAPSIDYDLLVSAMQAARPLYGDVKISGDPTVFRRQMEHDKALASLGGARQR